MVLILSSFGFVVVWGKFLRLMKFWEEVVRVGKRGSWGDDAIVSIPSQLTSFSKLPWLEISRLGNMTTSSELQLFRTSFLLDNIS